MMIKLLVHLLSDAEDDIRQRAEFLDQVWNTNLWISKRHRVTATYVSKEDLALLGYEERTEASTLPDQVRL